MSNSNDGTGRALSIVKRIALGVAGFIAVACLVGGVAVFALFGNELKTLDSIKKIDEYPLYTMDYAGDYGIDEFLEQGGASNDAELIDFVVGRLLKGLPIEIELPNLACSTFNAETPSGDAIFGRNFDLEFSPGMMVRTNPEDGYASLSMVNLAFIGYGEDKLPDDLASSIVSLAAPFAPLDGVNEKGLAVGVLLIDTEATDQRTDRVDITATTAGVSAEGKTYMAATSFLLTPGEYDFGGGEDRYATVMGALEAAEGVMDEQQAMDTLQSVSREVKIKDNGEVFQTQWSVVYNLDRGTAKICMGGKYDEVHELSIA